MSDVSLLRLEELLWALGKELSVYFDIQWPLETKTLDVVKTPFLELLNKTGYNASAIEDVFGLEGDNATNRIVTSRIAMLEFLFFQLQMLQLDYYEREYDFMSEPFFKNTVFSPEEKKTMEELSETLYNDYSRRSEVLCKRLDVTVESLMWSEKAESKLDEINRDLICTHKDILHIIKTSLSSKSTSLIKQIIVGNVPDRGGRTNDRRTAMPSFHKRVELSNLNNYRKSKKSKK
eukprot:gene16153-19221_t